MNTDESWPDFTEAERRVRGMQTKLHWWATRDAGRVFDDLHNLMYDKAFIKHAWERVRANTGGRTAGIDGVKPRSIPKDSTVMLDQLRTELKSRTYRPDSVRQKLIPKPGSGKKRRLGIPTTRDRIVQAVVKSVLEPIFEADFQPSSYGFRPRRRAHDAVAEIVHFANVGYHQVLEGDIEACFDRIDHTALMERIRGRVGDKRVLALVKAFLKAGILSEDGTARDPVTGTPQGGILSPLLANIALSVLDDHFQTKWDSLVHGYKDPEGRRKRLRRNGGATYRCVRYADDFVVLVHGTEQHAEAARTEVAQVLAPMGLHLSEAKTLVTHIDCGFDFLGWRIQRHTKKGTTRKVVYTYPSKKSLNGIVGKVKTTTARTKHTTLTDLLQHLEPKVRGWCQYFRHGCSKATFGYLSHYMWWRVTGWLRKRHPRLGWRTIRRRYLNGMPGHRPEENGTVLYNPATVPIEYYKWRGYTIPTPWTIGAEILETLTPA